MYGELAATQLDCKQMTDKRSAGGRETDRQDTRRAQQSIRNLAVETI